MSLVKQIEEAQKFSRGPSFSGSGPFFVQSVISQPASVQPHTELPDDDSNFLDESSSKTDLSDDEFVRLQEYILELMREENKDVDIEEMSKQQLQMSLIELIRQKDKENRIKSEYLYPLVTSLVNDIKDYGPIQEFMDNPLVTDIRIIGDKYTLYKIKGRYQRSDKPEHRFRNEEHLHTWINRKIKASRMGGRFDKSIARTNALLMDGSRLHAITNVSGVGEWREGKCIPTPYTIVSIRKFAKRFTVQELVETEYTLEKERQEEWNRLLQEYENIPEEKLYQTNRFMNVLIMAYLHLICRLRFTLLFAGGMGTGKTTTLNAIFPFIPSYHVNGIIEEAPEMQPDHEQTIRLWERQANMEGEGAITIQDLMKEILRMDVNRFFISELRDSIAYLFLQGIINGHPGGGSTIHANSTKAALLRLISLACSYPGSTRLDILNMIVEGVQTIIHIEKTDDDDKYIGEIAEVDRMIDNEIALRPIFTVEFSEKGDWGWKFHGLSEKVIKEARKHRMTIPTILQKPRDAFIPGE
ncbi:ATPase, T2SS/T4P/T4SS family [Aneurinibacillus terranovensis]|uniref:ATPase, T2SS/T4P/T4SS family n=1 Tax=Aneurinibacillus terranovensis TaxID=278991 RepID=UPI00041A18C3|nr:ATPase, T2SS/T4P/T4SS family [Aneurinibacillus terranovensis]